MLGISPENMIINNTIGMNMKILLTIFITFIIFLTNISMYSQSENVGIGTNSPDNSAVLHLDHSLLTFPRGFLAPRITTAERASIPAPVATGLLIFNTTSNRFEYYDGTTWVALIASGFTVPFSDISTGINTTATMTVGNGASLLPSGTGYVQANRFVGTGSTSDAVDLATAEVSGVLSIANGGTNANSFAVNNEFVWFDGTSLVSSGFDNTDFATSSHLHALLTAGDGISGGNYDGSAALTWDVNFAGSGTAITVSRSDHDHSGVYIETELDGIVGNEVVDATTNGGLVRAGTGTQADPYTLAADFAGTGSANTIARSDHDHTGVYLTAEVDGIVGNEVVNATTNGGLVRAGSGTGADPYTLAADFAGTGSANTIARSDHDHTGIYITAEVDGIIGNEVVNATTNGGLVRVGTGTGADPYTLGVDFAGTGTAATVARSDHDHANMITGSGVSGEVTFWDGVNSVTSSAEFKWDDVSAILELTGQFNLANSGGFSNNFVTDAGQSADYTYTLPDSYPASSAFLQSDNAGNLSWQTASTIPSGTDGQTLRFDASNALVVSSLIYNNGTNIGINTTSPNAMLTVDGVLSVNEQASSPSTTADYGKVFTKDTDSQLWFIDDGGTESQLSYEYASYEDRKSAGTDGGTFNNGVWQTRDLNTDGGSKGSSISLSSNQITLEAGTYRIVASAPAFEVRGHKTRFYNTTDGATALVGTTEYAYISSSPALGQTRSLIDGIITINDQKTFELQHQCQTNNSGDGLGKSSNFGEVEVYAKVYVQKIR